MSNFNQRVDSIKAKRSLFISDFSPKKDILFNNLLISSSDPELNSIRVHKYLTATKFIGKVETASYLDKIGLNEKTTIKNLSQNSIHQLLELFNLK